MLVVLPSCLSSSQLVGKKWGSRFLCIGVVPWEGARSVSYRPLLSSAGVSCLSGSRMGPTEASPEAGVMVCTEGSQVTDLMQFLFPTVSRSGRD